MSSPSASMLESPTADPKPPPPMIQTPPRGPVPAADVGEKTPKGDGFHPGRDAESQEPTHERGQARARYDGDSDEEPSFGVAL
jgi:hypothetical protein